MDFQDSGLSQKHLCHLEIASNVSEKFFDFICDCNKIGTKSILLTKIFVITVVWTILLWTTAHDKQLYICLLCIKTHLHTIALCINLILTGRIQIWSKVIAEHHSHARHVHSNSWWSHRWPRNLTCQGTWICWPQIWLLRTTQVCFIFTLYLNWKSPINPFSIAVNLTKCHIM